MVDSAEQREHLSAQWRELFRSLGADIAAVDAAFASLAAAYSSANRYYHNLAHVAAVLSTVAQLRSQVRDFAAVRVAAWFHDVVYDSRAKDNEDKSAAYARDVLRHFTVTEPLCARVAELILFTKTHEAPPDDRDAAVLLDADVAILGTSPPEYGRYAEAIRREYSWVPETAYRAGRRELLERFRQRPRIFSTSMMFAAHESAARRNLQEEIARLAETRH